MSIQRPKTCLVAIAIGAGFPNRGLKGDGGSAIAQYYRNDPATLPWLKDCFQTDERERVRSAVVRAIEYYRDDSDEQLREWLQQHEQ